VRAGKTESGPVFFPRRNTFGPLHEAYPQYAYGPENFLTEGLGRPILTLFIAGGQVNTGAAIQTGYHFLCILAVFFPLLYAVYILRSCIQGMGNSTMPMLSSLIQVVMRIVCASAVTGLIGNTGVFWGEVMAWLGADLFLASALLYRYKRLEI
jgi:Na+-driven multidrug efflux pump